MNLRREYPKTYSSFNNMRNRCNNKNHTYFKNYGGRGISVCDSWDIFANFFNDMGERPYGMTLDRIDPNKNYSPKNCKWSTITEQNLNKRKYNVGHKKFKGVYFNKRIEKIFSSIRVKGKSIHLGYFKTELEAAKAYNKKAKEVWGGYATLNII